MQGKVALITGAAKGLGKVFSQRLLEKGVKVCVADVRRDKGQALVEEFHKQYGSESAVFHTCDTSSEADLKDVFKKTVDKFGQLDIVVNNAGIMNETDWEAMLGINLTAMIRGTYLGIEHMGKHRGANGGVIVNVSSAAGVLPMPFGPVYTASKFGVLGFSRCWKYHPQKKEYGVRVNCLCPAFAQTDILKSSQNRGTILDDSQAIKIMTSTGIMKPEQVGDGLMPLLEDERLNGDVMLVTTTGHHLLKYNDQSVEDCVTSHS